jgi:hypothetical protein
MESTERTFPPIPDLGREDTHYGKIAHKAEKQGDLYTRSVYKIAQYLTLGLDTKLAWPEKLKYFRHALEKHAKAVPPIDEDVWAFYQGLEKWVKDVCGAEAIRLCEVESEFLTARAEQNEVRFRIVSDAAGFFPQFVPSECPDWFTPEDYEALRAIQLRWA